MTTKPAGVPPADLLPVQRKATLTYRLARILLLPICHLTFVFQVRGHENIPRDRNYVLIANHLGWLDAWIILASLPPQPPTCTPGMSGLPRPSRFHPLGTFTTPLGHCPSRVRGAGP